MKLRETLVLGLLAAVRLRHLIGPQLDANAWTVQRIH